MWRTIGTEGHVHIGGCLLFGLCFLFLPGHQYGHRHLTPVPHNSFDFKTRVGSDLDGAPIFDR